MKTLRRISIALTAVGAVMAYFQSDSEFDTLPFPAAGLSIRMQAKVKSAGEYHLVVAMPLTNDDLSLGLGSDIQLCSLTVQVARDYNGPIITNVEVTSISLVSEFGFGKIQYYSGGSWYLNPGTYDIDIKSRKTCLAAVSRGATISLEGQIIHPTETFLWDSLRHACGVVFFWIGIIGLLVCEFKRREKYDDGERSPGVD
jgi:hypothetical protein